MPEHVRITDVSPRDGLQNEPGFIPTEDKVRLIELLGQTGVDEIEVTSFVSPKWVPQLADATEVVTALASSPSLREGAGGRVLPAPARNPLTVQRAQALRKEMTGPEKELWRILGGSKLAGYRFRRQHPFGPFILDFYCASKKVVVEIDGRTHFSEEARQADEDRTMYLGMYGLHVVCFTNDDVIHNSGAVATRILEVLRERVTHKPFPPPPPSGRGRTPPVLSALVPNERGLQGVLDANQRARRKLISKISVFTAASETFSRRNTNASIAETIHRFVPTMRAANPEGIAVRGYVSCAVACPYEGPIEPARVVHVCRQLWGIDIRELDVADTIGAGTPDSIRSMLRTVLLEFPSLRPPPATDSSPPGLLTLHLHDTFGRAAECVRAALDLGVRSFDGSVAGLGGCPYASTPGKRAPGNIDTTLLVKTIHDAGYATGVNLDRLEEAAAFARQVVAKARTASTRDAECAGGGP